ncbi:MAG: four helix bundle protein [Verrucomicrobiota bacterium]
MNRDEMKKRTKQFGLRVLKPVAALPRGLEGQIVGRQLLRAGTSVGANYRAACRGRSKAEFIAKLGNVEEEADESAYWLEIIMDSGMMQASLVTPLHREAEELTAIMASSKMTARRNSADRKSQIENRRS